MKFLVLSRDLIKDYHRIIVYRELIKIPHIVISICDPEPKAKFVKLPNVSTRLSSLFLKFLDFDFQPEGYPYKIFNESQAKLIWDFFNDYKDKVDLVICQCEAGISRSAGVASALAKGIGQDDSYFFRCYLPNKLVYRLILKESLEKNKP